MRRGRLWISAACLFSVVAPVAAQDYEPLPEGTVNYAEHIAPIIYDHCLPCHGHQPTAPFPLIDYAGVRAKARNISLATRNGTMPPALADGDYGDIVNSGRLTSQQVGLIEQWVKEGSPAGDVDALAPPPEVAADWLLGPPDHVIAVEEPFAVPADAYLMTRNFALDLDLDEDRWVQAIALKPLPASVLRVFLYLDTEGRSLADVDDPNAVLVDAAPLQFGPDPAFGGQLLVADPWPLPEGVAQRLTRGSSAVLQVHFQATGVAATIRPEVGLYFAPAEPSRRLVTLSLGRRELAIPAGTADFHVESSFTLPVDVEAVGVLPNAHLVATELKAWAQTPVDEEVGLLWVKAWDYNYQRQYWYRQAKSLAAGTTLHMDYIYDNSDDNFNNPNYPAVDVTWGLGLQHEMAGLNLQLVVATEGDLAALADAYAAYRKR